MVKAGAAQKAQEVLTSPPCRGVRRVLVLLPTSAPIDDHRGLESLPTSEAPKLERTKPLQCASGIGRTMKDDVRRLEGRPHIQVAAFGVAGSSIEIGVLILHLPSRPYRKIQLE